LYLDRFMIKGNMNAHLFKLESFSNMAYYPANAVRQNR